MLATDETRIAYLGGWRGDRLCFYDGSAWSHILDLGFSEKTGVTQQRRVWIEPGTATIFVIEPIAGPVFKPDGARVRRIDAATRAEVGVEEGDDAETGEGPAEGLLFLRLEDGTLIRAGLDPATGRPRLHVGRLEFEFPKARDVTGTPARAADGAWWYPVRNEGLVRATATAGEVFPGRPAPGSLWTRGDAVACLGVDRRGRPEWFDGAAWQAGAGFRGDRWFDPARCPIGRLWAESSDGRIAILAADGRVQWLDGTSAAAGGGRPSDLVAVGGKIHAVVDGEPPSLRPV